MSVRGVPMKDALTVAAVGLALVVFGYFACGCPLRDPVPVEPDYPPMGARDAGRG